MTLLRLITKCTVYSKRRDKNEDKRERERLAQIKQMNEILFIFQKELIKTKKGCRQKKIVDS